ncbi:MAG: guanylate kinase [Clostridia bacterium]|nr:guanylate kinase [Clostridia bacterium]
MTDLKYKKKQGRLFVISGPSGVGKGTIINRILPQFPDMVLSVSATTRLPREREQHGVHYFFITKEQFDQMISQDGFLEYDGHFNNFYGTPKAFVFDNLTQGKDVLLEIDVDGALQVKNNFKDAVLIFIKPLSAQVLFDRLHSRNSESETEMANRVSRIKEELAKQDKYDYVVINDDLKTAVNEVYQIIKENQSND